MRQEDVLLLVDASIMGACFLYISLRSFQLIPSRRFFHYLLGCICGTSAVCHFSMFNGLLMVPAADGHLVRGALYVDWVVSTPIQLVVLCTIGRLPHASMFGLCYLDILMNACGFLGECVQGVTRWVYFVMGVLLFVPQWIFMSEDFDYGVVKDYFGDAVAQKYYSMGRFMILSRVGFPIIWVLEMTRVLPHFWALLGYSVMAMIAKIGLCLWVFVCLHAGPYLEPMSASMYEEENALSAVYASKTNSNQSSPQHRNLDERTVH